MPEKKSERASRDAIYRERLENVEPFTFNAQVVQVFDDMITRSVPGYQNVQDLCVRIAEKCAQPGTVVYDLGCSTGTTLIALGEALQGRSVRCIGVDSSPSMVERCRERVSQFVFREGVEVIEAELQSIAYEPASIVCLNYTLQFTPRADRGLLLRQIRQSVVPGGALILTEKIRMETPQLQRFVDDLHVQFKRGNRYSDLEIAQKREALENVLVPLTSSENLHLLRDAGFVECGVVAQWLNFATFVAMG